MTSPISDLLRPSLSEPAQLAAAPYSTQAGFFAAFFGGPLAAAAMLAWNAARLKRLPRDAPWVIAIVVAALAWIGFAFATAAGQAWQAQWLAWLGPRGPVYAERAIALLGFALGAWLHRREQRSADLFGLARPNGWIAGIGLIVGGNIARWLLGAALE